MERQRHVDRVQNQTRHRHADLGERERSLFKPVSISSLTNFNVFRSRTCPRTPCPLFPATSLSRRPIPGSSSRASRGSSRRGSRRTRTVASAIRRRGSFCETSSPSRISSSSAKMIVRDLSSSSNLNSSSNSSSTHWESRDHARSSWLHPSFPSSSNSSFSSSRDPCRSSKDQGDITSCHLRDPSSNFSSISHSNFSQRQS